MTDVEGRTEEPNRWEGTSPWRVRVEPNLLLDGLSVLIGHLVTTTEDGRQLYQRFYRHQYMQDEAPVPEGTVMPAPSLILEDELARALYEALARHYGYDVPTLRSEIRELRALMERVVGAAVPTSPSDQAGPDPATGT